MNPYRPVPKVRRLEWPRWVQGAVTAALFGCVVVGSYACNSGGQLPPNVVSVTSESIATIACMFNTYTVDTATQPTNWVQLALDLAANCGMDVAEIVASFGANSPVAQAANANAAQVHTSAAAFKAKLGAH